MDFLVIDNDHVSPELKYAFAPTLYDRDEILLARQRLRICFQVLNLEPPPRMMRSARRTHDHALGGGCASARGFELLLHLVHREPTR